MPSSSANPKRSSASASGSNSSAPTDAAGAAQGGSTAIDNVDVEVRTEAAEDAHRGHNGDDSDGGGDSIDGIDNSGTSTRNDDDECASETIEFVPDDDPSATAESKSSDRSKRERPKNGDETTTTATDASRRMTTHDEEREDSGDDDDTPSTSVSAFSRSVQDTITTADTHQSTVLQDQASKQSTQSSFPQYLTNALDESNSSPSSSASSDLAYYVDGPEDDGQPDDASSRDGSNEKSGAYHNRNHTQQRRRSAVTRRSQRLGGTPETAEETEKAQQLISLINSPSAHGNFESIENANMDDTQKDQEEMQNMRLSLQVGWLPMGRRSSMRKDNKSPADNRSMRRSQLLRRSQFRGSIGRRISMADTTGEDETPPPLVQPGAVAMTPAREGGHLSTTRNGTSADIDDMGSSTMSPTTATSATNNNYSNSYSYSNSYNDVDSMDLEQPIRPRLGLDHSSETNLFARTIATPQAVPVEDSSAMLFATDEERQRFQQRALQQILDETPLAVNVHAEEDISCSDDQDAEAPATTKEWDIAFIIMVFTAVILVGAVSVGIIFATSKQCNRNPNAPGCGTDPADPPSNNQKNNDTGRFESSFRCEDAILIGIEAAADRQLFRFTDESSPSIGMKDALLSSSNDNENNENNLLCSNITAALEAADGGIYTSWIQMEGTGLPFHIRAQQQNRNGQDLNRWMFAYKGGCDNLVCMNAATECPSYDCSLTIPTSSSGETYYIMLGGIDRFNFYFTARETVSNDVCESAEQIDLVESSSSSSTRSDDGLIVGGSHTNATILQEDISCAGDVGYTTWHSITGNGIPMTATTCVEEDAAAATSDDETSTDETNVTDEINVPAADFMPQRLTLLTGDCTDLQCVDGIDYIPCQTSNGRRGYQFTWDAKRDEQYRIVVSSSESAVLAAAATSSSSSLSVEESHSPAQLGPLDYKMSLQETIDNDLCGTARPLSITSDFLKVYGSNQKSTGDVVPACDDMDIGIEMGDNAQRHGTWWEMEGTGSLMHASTCRSFNINEGKFSQTLQVFKGSSCSALKCLGQAEVRYQRCGQSGADSSVAPLAPFNEVIWKSVMGETYYVLVSTDGREMQLAPIEIDESVVSVSSDATVAAASSNASSSFTQPPGAHRESTYELGIQAVADNNYCGTAFFVRFDGASEIIIDGSTRNATLPTEYISPCDGASTVVSPGVWYSVVGNDNFIEASTEETLTEDVAANDPTLSDLFDTQITILEGGCNSLRCVTGSNDDFGKLSTVTWFALRRVKYYILVHGGSSLETGDFKLQFLQGVTRGEANNECSKADVPLEFGAFSLPTATFGSERVFVQACGGFWSSGPGRYFKFIGTGTRLAISTCHWQTQYPARLTVLRADGGCDSLRCMGASYETCDINGSTGDSLQAARVEIDTVLNQTYYVLVHGVNNVGGTTGFAFGEALENNACTTPSILRVNDPPSSESVLAASIDAVPRCFEHWETYELSGVWFQTTTPETMVLSVDICMVDEMNVGTEINIYEGPSCDSLSCLGGRKMNKRYASDYCAERESDNDSVELVWLGQPNATYYIHVSADMEYLERFQITVTGRTPLDTDACSPSAVLSIGQRVEGSIMEMSPVPIATGCTLSSPWESLPGGYYGDDEYTPIVNALYVVRGTGKRMVASTCSDQLQSKVSVTVSQGGCDDLTCVAVSQNFCGANGQASWQSVEDELYYIVLTSWEYTNRSFVLTVGDIDDNDDGTLEPQTFPHDQCHGAVQLLIDQDSNRQSVEVSTLAATVEDDIDMCNAIHDQIIGGVWLTVRGSGDIVEVRVEVDDVLGLPELDPNLDVKQARFVVYAGSCDDLKCVHSNSQVDDADQSSYIQFVGEEGKDYYILTYNRIFSAFVTATSHGYDARTSCISHLNDPIHIFMEETMRSAIGHKDAKSPFVDPCTNSPPPPGAWFSFIGTGDRVRASTSSRDTNFAARIRIFEEGEDVVADVSDTDVRCSTLVCADITSHVDDDPKFYDTQFHYGVADWTTEDGRLYHIFVHGSDDDELGVFELTILPMAFEDECAGAREMRINRDNWLPTSAMLGPDITGTECDDGVSNGWIGPWRDAPGMWYTFVGTGNMMVVSTCTTKELSLMIIDTHISLFSGGCGELQCLVSNDDFCAFGSQITWPTELGREYFVLIRYFNPPLSDTEVTAKEVVKAGAQCDQAITVLSNSRDKAYMLSPTEDTTTTGLAFDMIPGCNFEQLQPNGAWFQVTGTGSLMMMTTHGYETRFNSSIAVYKGNGCDALECLESNVQSWSLAALADNGRMEMQPFLTSGLADSTLRHGSVSWYSEIGAIYYLYVSASSANQLATGTAAITSGRPFSFFATSTVPNDLCENAQTFNGDVTLSGETDRATPDDVEVCNALPDTVNAFHRPRTPGIWYRASLDGYTTTIQACSASAEIIVATVFVGEDCNRLVCLDTLRANRGRCSPVLEIPAEPGQSTFILVYNGGGTFEIDVTQVEVV